MRKTSHNLSTRGVSRGDSTLSCRVTILLKRSKRMKDKGEIGGGRDGDVSEREEGQSRTGGREEKGRYLIF
jgi:hypothetical protein